MCSIYIIPNEIACRSPKDHPEKPGPCFAIVNVGINNIGKGDYPEQVGQSLADNSMELQRKAPNAMIIFSAAICKPSSIGFPKVPALNVKIRGLCERHFITFINHNRLMTRPHQLRDDYHPNSEGGTRLLAYALQVALPYGQPRSLSQDQNRTRH